MTLEGPGTKSNAELDPRPKDHLVELRGVSKTYYLRRGPLARKVPLLAVDDVSFAVERGQTLGLVGATGSGKSTVAHLILGMIQPTEGAVIVGGHDLSSIEGEEKLSLQRLRQTVLQDPYSSLNPRMKVGAIVAEPLIGRRLRAGRSAGPTVERRVAELLELVGLPRGSANLFPQQFSGGQRQRIAIARAVSSDPQLIVLDEPTSALDVSVRAQVLNVLKELQDRLGLTYLVISHDLITVAYLSSTMAVMHRGRIVEIGPTKTLCRTPRHPQTLELLAGSTGTRTAPFMAPLEVEATVPTPTAGCTFASSCPLRAHLGYPRDCIGRKPPLVETDTDVLAACHFSDRLVEITQRRAD